VAKPRAVRRVRPDPEALFAARKRPKKLPFDFVLAELEELGPTTRPHDRQMDGFTLRGDRGAR
jgi:hypothetical protein